MRGGPTVSEGRRLLLHSHPPTYRRAQGGAGADSKTKISRILVNGLYSFQLASGRGMAIGSMRPIGKFPPLAGRICGAAYAPSRCRVGAMHGATRMPTPPTRSQRPCLTSCLLIYRLGPATLIGHVSSECGGLIAVYHLTAYPGPLNRSRTDVAPTAGATLERLYPYLNDFLRFCINRKGYGSLGAAAVLRTNDGDNPSMLHGPEHAAYEPSAYSTLGTAELFTLHHSWHDPDFLNAYLGTLPAQGEVLIGRGRPRPGRPPKGWRAQPVFAPRSAAFPHWDCEGCLCRGPCTLAACAQRHGQGSLDGVPEKRETAAN